jgi:hypothetical protein
MLFSLSMKTNCSLLSFAGKTTYRQDTESLVVLYALKIIEPKTPHFTGASQGNLDVVLLVGMKGLEPSRLAAHAPKACVSTNSTTSPWFDLGHYKAR